MTTKVTIQCHGYPVLVENLNYQNNNPVGKWQPFATVQPNETRELTLHSSIQLKITELPQFAENGENSS